ncbi:hypothetical protein R0135_08130 [Congregibacter variabilis]|uniref:NfeD-like C-terminal domain-containing protein n=1 Tax=Congregibacter variabilis TaxID=3081200 RepID=A0ABZ0I8J1_9GAMM|nr:hypothetical protein R0135_08130 [Congregibacter sp. IMCC43200]
MVLSLLLRYETWMIIGLALIVVDVLFGLAFFSLSFGVGGLVTGLGILLLGNTGVLETWQGTVTVFGVASVLVLFPLRRWARKTTKGEDDINRY